MTSITEMLFLVLSFVECETTVETLKSPKLTAKTDEPLLSLLHAKTKAIVT